MTKAIIASRNITKLAVDSIFNQQHLIDTGLGTISGNSTFGAPTVNQTRNQQYLPSVQAAIDGLSYTLLPVGGILLTDSPASPAGFAFREDVTFSGTANDVWTEIYGMQVPVAIGDDGTAVAAKAKVVMDSSSIFQAVTQTNDKLTITHKDRFPHKAELNTVNGITTTGVILDSSTDEHLCYGDWSMMHNETLGTEMVYYWKRIA